MQVELIIRNGRRYWDYGGGLLLPAIAGGDGTDEQTGPDPNPESTGDPAPSNDDTPGDQDPSKDGGPHPDRPDRPSFRWKDGVRAGP